MTRWGPFGVFLASPAVGGSLALGNDGWGLWYEPEGPRVVFFIEATKAGRLYMSRLHIDRSPDAVTPSDLRDLRIGLIEEFLNQALVAESWREGRTLHIGFAPEAERVDPPEDWTALGVAMNATGDLRLEVPPDRSKPDSFYKDVATVYSRARATGPKPVALIAKTNSLNPRTVHGWVKEARKRGLLAPSRRSSRKS